jgi:hypothetical protein
MNVDTGEVYSSIDEAVAQGEKKDDLVEVNATEEQMRKISWTIKNYGHHFDGEMSIPKGKK